MSAPSRQELRERIEALFAPDADADGMQQLTVDGLAEMVASDNEPQEPFVFTLDANAEDLVDEWLNEPNRALAGKRPCEFIDGDDSQRQRLASIVAAIEHGTFS